MASARIAVIDLGTNSTRLLVADVEDGHVDELDRRTTVTRLGDGVDASGRLADDAMERVFKALAGYRARIDELSSAPMIVAVATSAVRDASNGEEFRAALHSRFGIDPRTISGDEEATLTFRGATAHRPDDPRDTLVFDIGGGSTEFVTGRPNRAPSFHVSTKMGSVRHTERHLSDHDPPRAEDLRRARADMAEIIEKDVPSAIRSEIDTAIAVAGTATSLAAIDLELDPYDPERVHGHQLTRGAAGRILEHLASLTTEQRKTVKGLHPDRAPTIVAGAAILLESLIAFDLERVEVSEADILHGCALAAAER